MDFKPGTHVPGLDSLRGITILWPLFYHYNYVHGGRNVFEKGYVAWALMGVAAIDVFFVISGFLITGALLREIETAGHIDRKSPPADPEDPLSMTHRPGSETSWWCEILWSRVWVERRRRREDPCRRHGRA